MRKKVIYRPIETSKITLDGDLRYSLTVIQVPSTASWPDYTSIILDYTRFRTQLSPATITFQMSAIDEGSDWYLVPDGAEFTASTIASGAFKTFVNGLTPYGNTLNLGQIGDTTRYINNGTFYLGVNTGSGFIDNGGGFNSGGPMRNVFGWAKFSFNPAGIQLLDSAMTYDSAGIFVGTNTTIPIPEPETYAMLIAGLGILGFVVRRKKIY